jgi:hypothetical protein
MKPEVAVLIRREPLFSAAEAGSHHSASDGATAQTPADVPKLRQEVLVACRMSRVRLAEDTTDQKDLCL